jgi:DNA-binding NtrC family response regulator
MSKSADQSTDRVPWDDGARNKTFSLLVVSEGKTVTHPLPLSGRVIIGRSEKAEVRIDHKSVSREHARLHLGPKFMIEDLGSSNGTRVRDTPLSPETAVEVFPDDVIDLGAVILVIQYRQLTQRLRRFCPYAFFELRVEEECERAARTGGTFAVAHVEVEGGLNAHAIQLLLATVLRDGDLIAPYAPGEYQILFVDTPPDEAARVLVVASAQLAQRDVRVRSTLRSYPKDGRDPQRLLARRLAPAPTGPQRSWDDVVLHDESMVRIQRLIERIADSMLSVMLLGETGVGKEVCAEAIHRLSPRSKKPFLRLNCAALSETLLDSELFGHEKGAFTGALAEKPGLLESASGGTVFLDEVGDMPLATQVKLLRVLESKEVLRIGALKPRPVDIRVVAATHHDLQERISEGRFREDLFYRLNGISIVIPPLRERPADIEPLARHFATRFARVGQAAPGFSPGAMAWIRSYAWPGNVRELRNVIERAVILCDGAQIEPAQLPVEKQADAVFVPQPSEPRPARALGSPRPTASEFSSHEETQVSGGALRDEVKQVERRRIEEALADCHGNQVQAAKRLGLSRGALLRRLEQLQIPRPRKNAPR